MDIHSFQYFSNIGPIHGRPNYSIFRPDWDKSLYTTLYNVTGWKQCLNNFS